MRLADAGVDGDAAAEVVDGDEKGASIGKVDPARLENQYRILRDLGIIAKDFDYTKAYTTQFLPVGAP